VTGSPNTYVDFLLQAMGDTHVPHEYNGAHLGPMPAMTCSDHQLSCGDEHWQHVPHRTCACVVEDLDHEHVGCPTPSVLLYIYYIYI
jgi:hypothetical protein